MFLGQLVGGIGVLVFLQTTDIPTGFGAVPDLTETFGLVGLITVLWADMEPIPSILISAAAGLVVGGLAQALFLYVLSPSKSSHFSLEEDAIGREAQVTISIPGDGQGQISYNNVSGRVRLGARSATGERIANGQLVIIERIVGRAAVVRPVENE